MKTQNPLLAIGVLILFFGCTQKGDDIDLQAYEPVLNLHDTTNLVYFRFGAHIVDCENYALRMYLKYEDKDSLRNATYLDTDKVAFYVETYSSLKVGKDEFRLMHGNAGGLHLKFLSDSVEFVNVDDSNVTTSTYSIPRNVKIGSTFDHGTLLFSKIERLFFGGITVDCLVVEYSTSDVKFILWLNPQKFIVKMKMIGRDQNTEVLFLERSKLLQPVN